MLLVLRKKQSQYNRRVYAEYFVMTIFVYFKDPIRIWRNVFSNFYDKMRTE